MEKQVHNLSYATNCTLLFTELDLLERPQAARDEGFDTIEFWWPFATPTPGITEVDRFVEAVRAADVDLVSMNLFGGDLSQGERGVLSSPARKQDFRDSLEIACEIGQRLSIRFFNALYGRRLPDVSYEAADELAKENLLLASKALGEFGASVLIEPLSGMADYPITKITDVAKLVNQMSDLGVTNLGLLADVYHLALNDEPIDELFEKSLASVAHVQVADAPGRHEPGTGESPIGRWLDLLKDGRYDGYVSWEYVPSTTTTESLAFQKRDERSARAIRNGDKP